MTNLTLAMILALAVAALDPAALVQKLASENASERQSAISELEKLGRDALPALRAVRDSKEAKLRERARALCEKIESALLIKPTLVNLEFQDRPLADALGTISGQTGISLALEPANDPSLQAIRVNLHEAKPLPFWEALDRLSATCQIRHDPALAGKTAALNPVFHLRTGSAVFPKSFSGPFRVNLLSAHRAHEVAFGPKEEQADDEEAEPDLERFEVLAQVFAEPRLMITLNGPVKELKARDDFDQDLVPPPPDMTQDGDDPGDAMPPARISRGDARVPGTLSIVQFPIFLRAPDRPGTTIQTLEGFIPLQVASRKSDPLVVPLADAGGRTFKNDEVTLKFPDGSLELTARATIQVEIKMLGDPVELPVVDEPAPRDFPPPEAVDSLQNRVDILDAHGNPMIWTVGDVQPGDAGEYHVAIRLSLRNGKAVPAKLLYHGLTQAAIEVPFKFSKIPMP
jgi:hypothetical protein